MIFELIAGIVGVLSERFAALGPVLVAASTSAGVTASSPLACGAVVMPESGNCRGRNVAGNGDGGVKFGESVGLISAVMAGGVTAVAAGGEMLAGWRVAAVGASGAIVGSTIRGSFGRAGEIVTGVGAARSATLGRSALGEADGSLAIGCAGKMFGASAASGTDSNGLAAAATGSSHATGGHSQQQHRRFRSLQAAAGSTSKRHTEIQTNARWAIFRSRFITSSLQIRGQAFFARMGSCHHVDTLRLEAGRSLGRPP